MWVTSPYIEKLGSYPVLRLGRSRKDAVADKMWNTWTIRIARMLKDYLTLPEDTMDFARLWQNSMLPQEVPLHCPFW